MVGTFFLTVIPGLEIAAYLELCEKWRQSPDFLSFEEDPQIQIIKGGLEFKAPIELGLKLHPYLKIPTRMLLRLASFEAPKENAFRKEIKKIEWSLFFKKGQSFDVAFTSKGSRLSMKKQMIKIFEEDLRLKNEKGAPSIYIRIINDKCNISLDCTGERAQFRGKEKKVSMASLRESTAAGLLRILFQGLKEPFDLIDPMCGSGTFLSEAINLYKPMERKYA
ncbi:MAG: hypothetical protein MJK18_03000 [Bdellovibrionales bacterium]|nr:hypothetical protein [Bdellovibrionales bacterium]